MVSHVFVEFNAIVSMITIKTKRCNTIAKRPESRGGYSHFFFIRRLGPSIFRSPPNKYHEFQTPQNIFKFLATDKNNPIMYLDHKKRP